MEYNQFKNLLELKGTNDKENVKLLEELVEKFPYFQSARLLLAKSLHDQQSIHYDESLKLAAAYVTDRKVLHELIQKGENDPLLFKTEPAINVFSAKENAVEEKEPYTEWYSEDEISGRAFEEQKEQEKLVDPYAVIRKRLNEILVTKEEPKAEQEGKENIEDKKIIETEKPATIEKAEPAKESVQEKKPEPLTFTSGIEEPSSSKGSEMEEIIIQEAGKGGDVLDKMEIEHAMEESILYSLEKLPVIIEEGEPTPPKPKIKKEEDISEPIKPDPSQPKSFTEWLQSLSSKPFSQFEEVHSEGKSSSEIKIFEETHRSPETPSNEEADSDISDDELIERFIAAEPKIVPSKAEFYSPANQARKSVMEHEDVVSETLASIYQNQGNLTKAKWCYEKLSLLHPEKSSYFAALLKEIDQQLINKGDS